MSFRFPRNRTGFLSGYGLALAYMAPFANLALLVLICISFFNRDAEAQFLTQFSLTVGEEYNDNIFFSRQREHDFITHIIPTFSLIYQPDTTAAPTFKLDISPIGQIFARHSSENNFGDNFSLDGQYRYTPSPRLSFAFTDTLQLQGAARTHWASPHGIQHYPLSPQHRDYLVTKGWETFYRTALTYRTISQLTPHIYCPLMSLSTAIIRMVTQHSLTLVEANCPIR